VVAPKHKSSSDQKVQDKNKKKMKKVQDNTAGTLLVPNDKKNAGY